MSSRINSRGEEIGTFSRGFPAEYDEEDYGEKNCEYCGAYLPYFETGSVECPLCRKTVFGVPFDQEVKE